MTTWDGEEYQRRFDRLAESGEAVHGEVDLLMTYAPATVLDAGCGTGRVAVELARRGVAVVGVDPDRSMLSTARAAAPELEWHEASMVDLDLGRVVDLVVMAGNVPLFTPPGTERALVAGCAHHVGPSGRLVAGFQLDRGYSVEQYDEDCAAAGLELEDRWSTWDGDSFDAASRYAVSVHRPRRATDPID